MNLSHPRVSRLDRAATATSSSPMPWAPSSRRETAFCPPPSHLPFPPNSSPRHPLRAPRQARPPSRSRLRQARSDQSIGLFSSASKQAPPPLAPPSRPNGAARFARLPRRLPHQAGRAQSRALARARAPGVCVRVCFRAAVRGKRPRLASVSAHPLAPRAAISASSASSRLNMRPIAQPTTIQESGITITIGAATPKAALSTISARTSSCWATCTSRSPFFRV